jgi:hypothetical protein
MSNSSAVERELTTHELGFMDLDTPVRPQIVSGVAFASGAVDAETIWGRLQQFTNVHPQYRCRIVDQRSPAWRLDENFDLSNHCAEITLNESSNEDILTYVANEAVRGLPVGGPPWRIALIRAKGGVNKPERCAIAIWAHHSLIDGLEGMKFYSSLLDPRANSRNVAEAPHADAPAIASADKPRISGSCVRILARDVMRRHIKCPLSGSRSAQRKTLSFSWSRQVIRNARSKHNASFQEVLLAVLTDGLASYCKKHGKNRKLRAILPLGKPSEDSPGFASNRHDVGFINLPLAPATLQVRLKKIRRGLDSLRHQQRAQVFPTILNFLGRLPAAARAYVCNRWSTQANLLISVLPGGTARQQIGGVAVHSLFAQPALPPNHAIVIGAIATRRNVCLTVQIDPEVIGDPSELQADLAQAYASLAT